MVLEWVVLNPGSFVKTPFTGQMRVAPLSVPRHGVAKYPIKDKAPSM